MRRQGQQFSRGILIALAIASYGCKTVEPETTVLTDLEPEELASESKSQGQTLLDRLDRNIAGYKQSICKMVVEDTLGKIDGLAIAAGIDIAKFNPVGKVLGSSINVEYAFFVGDDGGTVGQAYFYPAGSLSVPAASDAVDFSIGGIYGCEGQPEKYEGYFATLGALGLSFNFGIDAEKFFANRFRDTSENAQAYDFNAAQERYFNATRYLREHLNGVRSKARAKAYGGIVWGEYLAAESSAHHMKLSTNTDGDTESLGEFMRHMRQLELGIVADFEANTLAKMREAYSLVKKYSGQKFIPSGSESERLKTELTQAQLVSLLGTVEAQLAQELHRSAKLIFPLTQYSRYRQLNTGRRVDEVANYRKRFEEIYRSGKMISLWVKAVMDQAERRHESLRSLRLLALDWMMAAQYGRALNADMSVGGIRKEKPWTSCNSIIFHSSAWDEMFNGANPKSVIGSVLSAARSASSPADVATGALSAAKGVLRTLRVGLSYYIPIPGTRVDFGVTNVGYMVKKLRDDAQGYCDDAAE